MELAARVRRACDPSFEPPRSIRSTPARPWARQVPQLPGGVAEAVARQAPEDGRLAVIAPRAHHAALSAALPGASAGPRPDLTSPVVLLDPRQAKGLEFDTVIVAEPAEFGPSDLYVALTRATQRLGVVHTGALPAELEGMA
jgi:hypothetical protein